MLSFSVQFYSLSFGSQFILRIRKMLKWLFRPIFELWRLSKTSMVFDLSFRLKGLIHLIRTSPVISQNTHEIQIGVSLPEQGGDAECI